MVVSRIIIILDPVEFAKFHVELAVRSDQQKGSHRSTIFSTVARKGCLIELDGGEFKWRP